MLGPCFLVRFSVFAVIPIVCLSLCWVLVFWFLSLYLLLFPMSVGFFYVGALCFGSVSCVCCDSHCLLGFMLGPCFLVRFSLFAAVPNVCWGFYVWALCFGSFLCVYFDSHCLLGFMLGPCFLVRFSLFAVIPIVCWSLCWGLVFWFVSLCLL